MSDNRHISRLEAMLEDCGDTWDLSTNDKAAIQYAVDRIAELEGFDLQNAALRHELTGVRNTLEAVGREKDELEQNLSLQVGASESQDERERLAGDKCGVSYAEHGCDWPDAVADVVLTLRRDAERWRECETVAEPGSRIVDGYWKLLAKGDTFAAAIDAAIAKRKDKA